MNIMNNYEHFPIFFLFKSFVKIELSNPFTIILFATAETHTKIEFFYKSGVCFSLVGNYYNPSRNSRQLIFTINAVFYIDNLYRFCTVFLKIRNIIKKKIDQKLQTAVLWKVIWAVTWDFQQCGICDQQSLRPACAYAQSDQSLLFSLEYSTTVKLLTEHHLKKRLHRLIWVYTCQMPHCWKSLVTAQLYSMGQHMSFGTIKKQQAKT